MWKKSKFFKISKNFREFVKVLQFWKYYSKIFHSAFIYYIRIISAQMAIIRKPREKSRFSFMVASKSSIQIRCGHFFAKKHDNVFFLRTHYTRLRILCVCVCLCMFVCMCVCVYVRVKLYIFIGILLISPEYWFDFNTI